MPNIITMAAPQDNQKGWAAESREGWGQHLNVFNVLPKKEEVGFMAKKVSMESHNSCRQKKPTLHKAKSGYSNTATLERFKQL